MPEVHSTYAIIANPNPAIPGDTGRISVGYYIVTDGVLTMTDSKGAAVRNPHNGERCTHKLADGEDSRAIASRLTKKIRTARAGGDAAAAFNQPLTYPPSSVC